MNVRFRASGRCRWARFGPQGTRYWRLLAQRESREALGLPSTWCDPGFQDGIRRHDKGPGWRPPPGEEERVSPPRPGTDTSRKYEAFPETAESIA